MDGKKWSRPIGVRNGIAGHPPWLGPSAQMATVAVLEVAAIARAKLFEYSYTL